MVRGTGAGVPGPAAGRAGARDLPEAAQGETRGAQALPNESVETIRESHAKNLLSRQFPFRGNQ